MSASPSPSTTEKSRAFPAIAWAGLIAGILDISSAFVIWAIRGVSPIRGLQGIATGLFGQDSFNRSLTSATLGLAAHFLIVFVAASLFYAASRKLRLLTEHAVTSGLTYGVAVYIFMTCVVLPLASIKPRHTIPEVMRSMTIVMFLVGLPIALIMRRYSRAPLASQPSTISHQPPP
jgi:uncharacterized membrane protein YagU involved in acid resistance